MRIVTRPATDVPAEQDALALLSAVVLLVLAIKASIRRRQKKVMSFKTSEFATALQEKYSHFLASMPARCRLAAF
jgi:hypothetical protein